METTHLYNASTQQPLQADDPEWREALSEALKRREMDREQERQGERKSPRQQRYHQQSA